MKTLTVFALAALLVASHAEAAKPEGKGKQEPTTLVAVDADGFLLGPVLGVDASGFFWFYNSDIEALVSVKNRDGTVVNHGGSTPRFAFETSDCSGTATVFRLYAPMPVTLAFIEQPAYGPNPPQRRYFAPVGVATSDTRPVFSELVILSVNSRSVFVCAPLGGNPFPGVQMEEVFELPFLDPIPLPISVVPQ